MHARGQFVARNARGQFGVAGEFLEVPFVEALEKTARGTIGFGTDACRSREVAQRFAGQRALTQRLLGEESAMTTDEFAAASFGLDSEATTDLARLRQQREQRGRRQSGAMTTATGVVGFGTSN